MIDGSILIGGTARRSADTFRAINAATGEAFGPEVCEAAAADVADACTLAAEAAPAFAALAPDARAAFLEAIAEAIIAIGDPLVETAMAESGLPRGRLEGERMRTVNQLRLFAGHVRAGDWLDATIDPALPERSPPRPDLRRMNLALGPVAVFGASNFPLAFSVAGGDTASALAAGCPVVVKGHPAHPGTGELVARAILAAVTRCGLPAGVFAYLPGRTNALGAALVSDPRIKAVGFTGSRAGGLALAKLAAERPEPIPVFAEMSSVNPVLLLPGALAERAEALGAAFVASLTLGAGQFCTNPGLVLALAGPELDHFVAAASAALGAAPAQMMLTAGIDAAYRAGVAALAGHSGATCATQGEGGALFVTDAATFQGDPSLGHEVFGPSAVVVRCSDEAELAQVIAGLEGQLTATLHTGAGDDPIAGRLLPLLADRAGRMLANGWPTGVEVTHAMVHGGPFPATTDSRTTSVGTLAITRFLRPVCFQDLPDTLLPLPLQRDNPWRIPRKVDGQWVRP